MSKMPIFKSCLRCSFTADDEKKHQEHFSIHEYESNFVMSCFFCPQRMRKLRYYKHHTKSCKEAYEKSQIESFNEIKPKSACKSELTWQCSVCDENLKLSSNQPNLEDFNLVARHFCVHAKSVRVSCFICAKLYSNHQVFLNHVNIHRKRKKFKLQVHFRNHGIR